MVDITRKPSGIPIFIFARFLIRPTGHAQHLRHVHISQGKWLSGNNSEYRRIYTVPTRRPRISKTFCEHSHPPDKGARGSMRRIGEGRGGNWKSLAAISLSILYYRLDIPWKRRNVVCNKSSLAILD